MNGCRHVGMALSKAKVAFEESEGGTRLLCSGSSQQGNIRRRARRREGARNAWNVNQLEALVTSGLTTMATNGPSQHVAPPGVSAA
jgi:hypothetical protein